MSDFERIRQIKKANRAVLLVLQEDHSTTIEVVVKETKEPAIVFVART